LLLFPLLVNAQSGSRGRSPHAGGTRNEAPDFTITTTDGITRNLYATLDSGKTVFIDLFYTTCYYCQLYAPVIEEIYQNNGAGEGSVEFWGISNSLWDTNHVIDEYKATYNVNNPCAGPWGGGLTAFSIITEGQNFQGFPTYVVVCPDRVMYFDPCYPPTVQGFDPYFAQCASSIGIETPGETKDYDGNIAVYPNPASDRLFLDFNSTGSHLINLRLYNLLGETVSESAFVINTGMHTRTISTDHLVNGMYYLKIYRNNKLADTKKVLIYR
jgi:thiol-disulfide isomerase/thioredoxin